MLKAIRGVYREGQVVLEGDVPDVEEARVIVTFLHPEEVPHADSWASVCGAVSDVDAEEMLRAIEEGCERIDPETWDLPC